MSPAPLSPAANTTMSERTLSHDSTSDSIRKRVCKACDRCRLKKSKCDGSHPCSRCKADNAICVFGERKKSQDKVYPKGYVEMLEQQQAQLVSGLQEMYRRLQVVGAWSGPTLPEAHGHPLTHDILAALDLLETKSDGSGDVEAFEEDFSKLQARLVARGSGYARRRGSLSSESEHSHHHHHSPRPSELHDTPMLSKPQVFKPNFNFSTPTTPLTQSPAARHSQTFPLPQSSPLSGGNPPLHQAEWAYGGPKVVDQIMRSDMALQTPDLDTGLEDLSSLQSWDTSSTTAFDLGMAPYAQPYQPIFGSVSKAMEPLSINALDPMDFEFAQFVQVG